MADGIRAVAQVIFSDKIDEPINILERAIRLGMEAGAAYVVWRSNRERYSAFKSRPVAVIHARASYMGRIYRFPIVGARYSARSWRDRRHRKF
jgi:hypothetical protein